MSSVQDVEMLLRLPELVCPPSLFSCVYYGALKWILLMLGCLSTPADNKVC